MIHRAVIIPTGDEILSGTVLDTDSPEILACLTAAFPACSVCRTAPVADREDAIVHSLLCHAEQGADLIVLIGGSGGGHRHDASMTRDYTHTALDRVLEGRVCRELYGKNGHLWSRLLCGRCGKSLVINVPGPFAEARAAIRAFCAVYPGAQDNPAVINEAMAAAVLEQYG